MPFEMQHCCELFCLCARHHTAELYLILSAWILMHYHSVEVRLYEIAFRMPRPTNDGTQVLQLLETLNASLTSTISFFEHLYLLPPTHYERVPFVAWAQFAIAVLTLSKLVFYYANYWDLAYVRKTAQFSDRMERVAMRFEEAGSARQAAAAMKEEYEDIFLRYAGRVRWLKIWYEAKLATEPEPGIPPSENVDVSIQASEMMNGDFSYLDEDLWQGFISDWDHSESQRDGQMYGSGIFPVI